METLTRLQTQLWNVPIKDTLQALLSLGVWCSLLLISQKRFVEYTSVPSFLSKGIPATTGRTLSLCLCVIIITLTLIFHGLTTTVKSGCFCNEAYHPAVNTKAYTLHTSTIAESQK